MMDTRMQRQDSFRLAEEAADWMLRRMEDRSPECGAQFIHWLKISPRHIDEFLLAATTYMALRTGERVDVPALLEGVPTNIVPLAPNAAPDRTTGIPAAPAQQRSRAFARRGLAMAAGIAALAAGAWLLWPLLSGKEVYSTGIGEQRSVRLEDGSLLHLNTRTRIEVRYTADQRQLRLLQGEALFAVAPQNNRPFRVLTDSAVVQAVGTQFNVYEHGGRTEVKVLEGRVRVTAPRTNLHPPALLSEGEQANVLSSGRVIKTAETGATLPWRQRRLVFRAVPLATVAEEFNRYNESQLRIESPALARRLIWGVFPVDEPQALVKFLRQDASVELRQTDAGWTIEMARE